MGNNPAMPHPAQPSSEGAVAMGAACPDRPLEVGVVAAGTPRPAWTASERALTPHSPLAAMGKVAARVLLRPTGKRSARLVRRR
jgi:hypothetical protein